MQSKRLRSERQGGRVVEKSRKGDLLIVRFADGEDLVRDLEKLLKEEKIHSGLILGGLGMVKNAGLSFYVGRGERVNV
jgi:predicted DNA-binding protein with PD1-like motif